MPSSFEHYWSVFFFLGLLVVMAFAWQRFNQPSFPNQRALPRAVDPLRYLFLKPAYRKARLTYLVGLMLLYVILVAPGPKIVPALGTVGAKDFPPEAWALLAALILTGVGLAPDSFRWLNMIEDQLRRWVHEWFLVPNGIERTIGVLEDARYDPPPTQFNLVQNRAVREKLQEDLRLPPGTLRYRWARATILMVSLRQMGAGVVHPLSRAAFEPFEEDFQAILVTYRVLRQDVEALGANATSNDAEENLTTSVDNLLKRIYAYISWGIRHQADSEQDVDQTLEELGFRIPKTGGRRLFDIVVPAVLLVAFITMAFWVAVDAVTWAMGGPATSMSDSVVDALSPAIAASFMYGSAVFIALKRRAAQIEQKVWREGSPRCLIPIAVRAGLVTWAVIIATTVVSEPLHTWQSLTGLGHALTSVIPGNATDGLASAQSSFLPTKIATAVPWLLVGAIVSAVLASCLSGDVRRTDKAQRVRDVISLGIAAALAAGVAQLIQGSLAEKLGDGSLNLSLVPVIGLAGFACGAVIGFTVPVACRVNLVTPLDPIMARALRDLLGQAEAALGSKAAAENWVFMPHTDLGGITPAEAVQHKTHATGVRRLLESEASRRRDEARRDGLAPVVIEGGLSDHRPVDARAAL